MTRSLPPLVRVGMGISVFVVYAALASASFLVLRLFLTDPPSPWMFLLVFVGLVVIGGYVGHRLGVVRLLTSFELQELSPRGAPAVYRRLDRLVAEMDVRPPRLLVADMNAPNAFSLGTPSQSVVVLDARLFSLLTVDELEAILSHELAHIESRDTLVKTFAITGMRLIVGVVFVVLSPVLFLLLGIDRATAWVIGRPDQRRYGLAWLFQLAVQVGIGLVFSVLTVGLLAHSRKREFAADSRAVTVTGDPVALARALAKIHRATASRRGILSLLYVEHEQQRPPEWLSTHPAVERRIERLLDGANRQHGDDAAAKIPL